MTIFLSTLSLRRATWGLTGGLSCDDYFYPRSPCGERHSGRIRNTVNLTFLSTLSLRRATCKGPGVCINALYFYPRSPCGERLRSAGPWQVEYMDFYPRSPCGERRQDTETGPGPNRFLSTLSLRRATTAVYGACRTGRISIHALLAESDHAIIPTCTMALGFLSTLSLRRATSAYLIVFRLTKFISIHALLAESDAHW